MSKLLGVGVVTILLLAASADASAATWSPGSASYTRALSAVRTQLADFHGAGVQAKNLSAKVQKCIAKADRKLGVAQTVLGRNPGWSEYQKSLEYVAKAQKYLEKAARKASTDRAVKNLVYGKTGTGPTLEALAIGLVKSASTHAGRTAKALGTRKATKKMAKASRYLLQAAAKAAKTSYSKAIGEYGDAIRILGRAGLL